MLKSLEFWSAPAIGKCDEGQEKARYGGPFSLGGVLCKESPAREVVLCTRARIFARFACGGSPMRTQTEYPIQRLGSSPINSLSLVVRELLGAQATKVLQLVFEQSAVREDHLRRVISDADDLATTLSRLEDLHLVTRHVVLPGTPAWLVPTGTGAYAVSPAMAGRQVAADPPRPRFLRHFMAVNELRFQYEERYRSGTWISERMLYVEGPISLRGKRCARRPDGAIKVAGRFIAVEAELSTKDVPTWTRIINNLFECYDEVHFYCAPKVHFYLERLQCQRKWPRLQIEMVSDVL